MGKSIRMNKCLIYYSQEKKSKKKNLPLSSLQGLFSFHSPAHAGVVFLKKLEISVKFRW